MLKSHNYFGMKGEVRLIFLLMSWKDIFFLVCYYFENFQKVLSNSDACFNYSKLDSFSIQINSVEIIPPWLKVNY